LLLQLLRLPPAGNGKLGLPDSVLPDTALLGNIFASLVKVAAVKKKQERDDNLDASTLDGASKER